MNILKKFAVSLTALTTVATLGIGSFSVSANELTTAKDKFIASYKNANEVKAASYYIENGLSVEEAKKMMDLYQEGALQIAASKNSMARTLNAPVNFYNGTNFSSNQHYAIIIADNGAADVEATFRIEYDDELISPNANSVKELGSYYTIDRVTPLTGTLKISGYLDSNVSDGIPVGTCDVPVNVTSNSGITSEAVLYNELTLNVTNYDSLNNENTTFRLETYVNGDVNHDGIVNSTDVTLMTDYNIGTKTLEEILNQCEYTETHENIADIVNKRAMDTDKNGEIAYADLVMISQMVE